VLRGRVGVAFIERRPSLLIFLLLIIHNWINFVSFVIADGVSFLLIFEQNGKSQNLQQDNDVLQYYLFLEQLNISKKDIVIKMFTLPPIILQTFTYFKDKIKSNYKQNLFSSRTFSRTVTYVNNIIALFFIFNVYTINSSELIRQPCCNNSNEASILE
jgi:hypothetical protein